MTTQPTTMLELISILQRFHSEFGDLPIKAYSGIDGEPPYMVTDCGLTVKFSGNNGHLLIEGIEPC